MQTTVQTPPGTATQRRRSDWIGFAFYTAIAGVTAVSAPAFTVFLLPTIVHETVVGLCFILRGRARRRLAGWQPQLTAYAACFLILVFVQVARLWQPAWLAPSTRPALVGAGIVLWAAGAALTLWPLWHLRYSFSLEPAARQLVTSGPYGFARHPIYAGYLVQYAGFWLVHPTIALGGVLGLWLVLTIRRTAYEERVLEEAFPEYGEYRRRVGRFGPRLPLAA